MPSSSVVNVMRRMLLSALTRLSSRVSPPSGTVQTEAISRFLISPKTSSDQCVSSAITCLSALRLNCYCGETFLKHVPLIPAKAGIQGQMHRSEHPALGPRWSLSLGGPKVRPEGGDERDGCRFNLNG